MEGVVVDETGAAIAAARVVWIRRDAGPAIVAHTDSEGRFRLDGPRDRPSIRLQAWAADGPRVGAADVKRRPDLARPDPAADGPVRLVVKPARSVTVRVVDAAGRPVPDATAEIMTRFPDGGPNASFCSDAWTDPEGVATLAFPADSRIAELIAFKSGLGLDYLDQEGGWRPLPAADLPAAVTLKLGSAWTAKVRVVDDDGHPVPDCGLYMLSVKKREAIRDANLSGSGKARAWTGPDGVATIGWLPAGAERAFSFRATLHDEYHQPDPAPVTPAAPDVRLTLVRRVPVGGRVTDADGRPVGGATVAATGRGIAFWDDQNAVRTEADGSYRMLLAPDEAYAVGVTEGRRVAAVRDLLVRKGEPLAGIDFVLAEGARLHGRVTDEEGRPVAGESVYVKAMAGPFPEELSRKADDRRIRELYLSRSAATDAEGRYEILLGPGPHVVTDPRRSGPGRGDPWQLTVFEGADIVRDFVVSVPTTTLMGVVVRADGHPVPNAGVVARYASRGGPIVPALRADAEGRFRLERTASPMMLRAMSPDGSLLGVSRVAEAQPEVRIAIGPTATAVGRLLDPKGKPVAGRKVQWSLRISEERPDAVFWFGDGWGGQVETDAEGRFAVESLVPGEEFVFNLDLDGNRLRTLKPLRVERPGIVELGDQTVSLSSDG